MRNLQGMIVGEVRYPTGNRFTNHYNDNFKVQIKTKKELVGRELLADEFEFELYEVPAIIGVSIIPNILEETPQPIGPIDSNLDDNIGQLYLIETVRNKKMVMLSS